MISTVAIIRVIVTWLLLLQLISNVILPTFGFVPQQQQCRLHKSSLPLITTQGKHKQPPSSVLSSSLTLLSSGRKATLPFQKSILQQSLSSQRNNFHDAHKNRVNLGKNQFKSPLLLFMSSTGSDNNNDNDTSNEDGSNSKSPKKIAKLSFGQRVKYYFSPFDDGLTFRQRLAKMGLSCVLSYGFVSNMSYCVSVSIAWFIFSKQTGKSPLAPGQWKPFLAVYAGFWVFNNIIRPIRLAVAVALGPQFDKIVLQIEEKLRVSRAVAITLVVLLANLVGTTLFMCLGILSAATLAGVPVFAGKI